MGRYMELLPIAHHTIDGRSTLGGNKGGREGASSRLSCITAALQCGSAHCFYFCKTTKIAFVSDLKVI